MQPLLSNVQLVELFLFCGGAALAAFQWLIKKWVNSLETDLKNLQTNQKDIDQEIQKIKNTYVEKADLIEFRHELIARLTRIESYLLDKKNV